MILYSQVLNEIADIDLESQLDNDVNADAEPTEVQIVALAGIPFEQPNPADSRVLRSLALYLAGVHLVSTDGILSFS